jgi:hypothetical protein
MAYTKNTWTDGDIVTSEKLNHIEDGVRDAYVMMNVGNVTVSFGSINGTLDKTWQEIFDAVSNGNICYFTGTDENDEYHKKIFIVKELYRDENVQHPYVVYTVEDYGLGADSPTQRPTIGSDSGDIPE